VRADTAGYEEALWLAEQHAAGRRAFAVEGTGSFGAGLTRFLVDRAEQVFEVGRLRRERTPSGLGVNLVDEDVHPAPGSADDLAAIRNHTPVV